MFVDAFYWFVSCVLFNSKKIKFSAKKNQEKKSFCSTINANKIGKKSFVYN